MLRGDLILVPEARGETDFEERAFLLDEGVLLGEIGCRCFFCLRGVSGLTGVISTCWVGKVVFFFFLLVGPAICEYSEKIVDDHWRLIYEIRYF